MIRIFVFIILRYFDLINVYCLVFLKLTFFSLKTTVASARSPWHDMLRRGRCSASGSMKLTKEAASLPEGKNTTPKLVLESDTQSRIQSLMSNSAHCFFWVALPVTQFSFGPSYAGCVPQVTSAADHLRMTLHM